jgi:hypothetical protein
MVFAFPCSVKEIMHILCGMHALCIYIFEIILLCISRFYEHPEITRESAEKASWTLRVDGMTAVV